VNFIFSFSFYIFAQRFAAMRRAGLLPGIVLLETLISRIRNLSTEDGFPAWRIADVELNLKVASSGYPTIHYL